MKKRIDIKKALAFFYSISVKDKAEWVLKSLIQQKVFSDVEIKKLREEASKGIEYVAKKIKDPYTKHWIYRQIYLVAYDDRVITKSEQKILRKVSELLKINPDRVKKIENWVKKYYKTLDEGEKILI